MFAFSRLIDQGKFVNAYCQTQFYLEIICKIYDICRTPKRRLERVREREIARYCRVHWYNLFALSITYIKYIKDTTT